MSLAFRPNVSIVDTDYGSVLLDERKGRYFQLNPSGRIVVRTLLEGGGSDEAAGALIEEYDVSRERAEQDVTALVEGLRAAGLVTP
ncbi:lasso peptide biosynthesis PqqD family chaperone [Amycolatopsis sp. WAC 01416]|uniref:lasso peptide biosynthesis PqqD family chaperone n=1 Tax=Amycolatopsis sp. WAC 01416 TaxID=2203196 RepID=UPI000F780C55|nr:lasso peptide biosynthesis PqqD family chaperone [Amycolatopsis sp. WAC 01416]RSN30870.1 lasso peptide biosynthesis PqqD family chaperone [Amycolatopsis sp. WAC 01416]